VACIAFPVASPSTYGRLSRSESARLLAFVDSPRREKLLSFDISIVTVGKERADPRPVRAGTSRRDRARLEWRQRARETRIPLRRTRGTTVTHWLGETGGAGI
jgi:hypothetical protein